MVKRLFLISLSCLGMFLSCCNKETAKVTVSPQVATVSVPGSSSNCAIWNHPTDPTLSLIIGSDMEGEGGLYCWDLKGETVFYYGPLIKPTGLDVRYGFSLGSEKVDIVVVGTHENNTLRVLKIDQSTRQLIDITIPEGISTGAVYQIEGLCLYQHPSTGATTAFVSVAKSHADLIQISLIDNGSGQVNGKIIRSFGGKEVRSLIYALCADDEEGFLYCTDQSSGILKFHADPTSGEELVSRFATGDGITGNRAGLALYLCPNLKGYLILSSPDDNQLKIYDRSGNNALVLTMDKTGSINTNGIAVTSCQTGQFPHGFVVCQNDDQSNYVLYDWSDIARHQLLKCYCKP
jgi:3-phytase